MGHILKIAPMIDTDICQHILPKCLTGKVNTHNHEITQK